MRWAVLGVILLLSSFGGVGVLCAAYDRGPKAAWPVAFAVAAGDAAALAVAIL